MVLKTPITVPMPRNITLFTATGLGVYCLVLYSLKSQLVPGLYIQLSTIPENTAPQNLTS